MAGTLAMLSESAVDDRERSRLVGLCSWRAIFWLNLPIIVAALVPIIVHHPASPRLVPGNGDAARETGWSESSRPSRIRLALACLVAGLLNFCVLATLFLFTRHFQDVRGLSPFQAGLATLPALVPLLFFGGAVGDDQQPLRRVQDQCARARRGRSGSRPDWADGLRAEPVGLSLTLVVWAIGVGVLMPAIVAAAMHALPGSPGFASGAGSSTQPRTSCGCDGLRRPAPGRHRCAHGRGRKGASQRSGVSRMVRGQGRDHVCRTET